MGSPPTMFTVFYCALFLGAFTAANADTVTVSQSEEETRGSCPAGWFDATMFEMGCLLTDSSDPYTWDKANEFCYTQGGKLVEISHEEEMEFLINYLKVLDHNGHDWWTAGTDIGREGNWVWLTSLRSVESYVWYSSQPNGGAAANCLALGLTSYMGYDVDCATHFTPICQKK